MAKFQDKHLKLKDNQRVYFGTSDDSSIWFDGSELRIATVVSGVDPTQDYHLTTKQYVDTVAASVAVDWQDSVLDQDLLGPPGGESTGDRYIVGTTATGTWAGQDENIAEWNGTSWDYETPTEGTATWVEDENLLYIYNGTDWVKMSSVFDHGNLQGLGDDDHTQYILSDGTRAFSGTVSGITPTVDAHLTTKGYVDGEITTLAGSIVTDHGGLTGTGDDDHTQYILVDGTRAFSATVSGVDPTADAHLATKSYVDGVTGTLHESGRTTLALNDSSKAITFGTAFADTNYSVSVVLTNTTDGTPSIYPMMISAKATTGFTVLFSGDIDSNNYVLEWIAKHD